MGYIPFIFKQTDVICKNAQKIKECAEQNRNG